MLDARSERVLYAVVQSYITQAGPVGSRHITKKYPFGLSSATIRNIMSDLEEMGFLRQPHTSAGRVPTDSGYRFYVDHAASESTEQTAGLAHELAAKLDMVQRDVNAFLNEATRLISGLSHYIGIAMSPNTDHTTLSRIELVKYRTDRLAVILLTDEGILRNKITPINSDVSQRDLDRVSEYINSRFAGRTIDEIRRTIVSEITRERSLCERLIEEAVTICGDIFSAAPATVHISGISEVLSLPDFGDIDRIRDLVRTLEDKHLIVRLLDSITNSAGIQVYIGSENPLDEMKKFSLVAATYREGFRPMGVVGIIGPTRMNYPEAILLVDMTAKFITQILSLNR